MPKTTILIIEYNQEFYKRLAEKYKGEKNLHTINGSAENLNHYMRINDIPYADAIVPDLPFASLPQEMSDSILASIQPAFVFSCNMVNDGNQLKTIKPGREKPGMDNPLLFMYFSIDTPWSYKQ
ncbi:hypothetical protein [Fictibacillus terranigra]|uniref:Uncharacterized protein n=1 Tax=Fictibacillus terranigra TaxID=3058424 RepID=A0ABT8E8L3_9BACL|nr:hypothetical protein [Fictibacillus sp. CENA-BCM004]MDN4074256.1 hypothetical protein [Fictibacillus sp. CENA-BCM004]